LHPKYEKRGKNLVRKVGEKEVPKIQFQKPSKKKKIPRKKAGT
jgi:hypothetical protein